MTTLANTPAVSYLRISGLGQAEGDGFERQSVSCDAFSAKERVTLLAAFFDKGVTGKNDLENREGLSDLLEFCQELGVKLVVVENATRLARDLMVQESILAKFRQLGIVVLGADGTDLTVMDGDPTRKFIRQVLGAVAEFDRALIVAKLRGARDRIRKKQGKCEGRKSFGEHPKRPQEVAILGFMAELRGQGVSCVEIAGRLNAEGNLTRYGRRWTRSNVHKVLQGQVATS
jgi:DNA invertase Pin-like site-specific DNA recombinase